MVVKNWIQTPWNVSQIQRAFFKRIILYAWKGLKWPKKNGGEKFNSNPVESLLGGYRNANPVEG